MGYDKTIQKVRKDVFFGRASRKKFSNLSKVMTSAKELRFLIPLLEGYSNPYLYLPNRGLKSPWTLSRAFPILMTLIAFGL